MTFSRVMGSSPPDYSVCALPIWRWIGPFLVLWTVLVAPVASDAYQVMDVVDGGAITGRVVLSGQVPEPRAFPMVLYPTGDFCKKISDGEGHVLLKEFNTDESGGLQDAIVSVFDVERGKGFSSRDTRLLTVNCMFHPADIPEHEQFELHDGQLTHVHPLVTVMRDESWLTITNRDPVMHAAQVYQPEKGNRVLSFPIPVSYKATQGFVRFDADKRIAQIICGLHEYMQTWAWIVRNPYFARTKKGGQFEINNLPPGTYQVGVWHPHMDLLVKTVTIRPGRIIELVFEMDGSQVVRPIYERQKQFRISPERNPYVDLKGCEGPFCVRRTHDHESD